MRGGARESAGRKPKLDPLQRLAIGAECDKRFKTTWINARNKLWESRIGVPEIHALQIEYGQAVRDWGLTSSRVHELSEEIAQAVRTMRRTPGFVEGTNRVFTVKAARPKGVKSAICEAVAAQLTVELAQPIKPSFVMSCWTAYRQFEKETGGDDPTDAVSV